MPVEQGMVEMAARAAFRAVWHAEPNECERKLWEPIVRAVIAAMREPTPAIVIAIDNGGRVDGGARHWRAAIDAALADTGGTR